MMTRRALLTALAGLGLGSKMEAAEPTKASPKVERLERSDAEWKKLLTAEQYRVLRRDGTEAPHSSPLNKEKRPGTFHCVACDLPLFASTAKYESGTGWPSFFTSIPGAFETRKDFKLILPRIEYCCARCGGHHGHVFDDGPPPTGQRWCNNGIALKFLPKNGNAPRSA